jgi:hypothetical protein
MWPAQKYRVKHGLPIRDAFPGNERAGFYLIIRDQPRRRADPGKETNLAWMLISVSMSLAPVVGDRRSCRRLFSPHGRKRTVPSRPDFIILKHAHACAPSHVRVISRRHWLRAKKCGAVRASPRAWAPERR